MSQEAVRKLFQVAENNPQLLRKFQDIQNPKQLIMIALELGYEFTETELLVVMEEKQISLWSDELSESELEAVSGGRAKNETIDNNYYKQGKRVKHTRTHRIGQGYG